LIISTLEVAPTYQLKEIQRNIGKPLKPVLIKLLDDSKWSFYAKDNKKYIGTALFGDSEFKVNKQYKNLQKYFYPFIPTPRHTQNDWFEEHIPLPTVICVVFLIFFLYFVEFD